MQYWCHLFPDGVHAHVVFTAVLSRSFFVRGFKSKGNVLHDEVTMLILPFASSGDKVAQLQPAVRSSHCIRRLFSDNCDICS